MEDPTFPTLGLEASARLTAHQFGVKKVSGCKRLAGPYLEQVL